MGKPQILIVEDERIVAISIQNMLNRLGYGVSGVTSSGKDAIKIADEKKPDLVLMDIMLNGDMDGIKVAKKIHDHFNIPVIFLTAYADEETLQQAKITEPFGYILKPFDERELRSNIEMALYKNKMEKKSKEREKWLSTVLNSINDAVIATDKERLVTFMNSAAESLTGLNLKYAYGQDFEEVFNITISKRLWLTKKDSRTRIRPVRKEMNPSLNQAILINKRRKEIPIDHSYAPIRDHKGNILGSVLVLRDITEKKNAEKKLRQSYEKLRKAFDGTIQTISFIMEKRDPYTAGHQRRVSQLVLVISESMGFSKDQIEGIHTAARIHDIGKILLPSEILNKPGELTELEYNMIKTHPKTGYDILKTIEFPYPIAQIILQHHERMNGSGYPQGLKGEDILLEARILGVADVVEAMSSHRPYRAALGVEKALIEISQNKRRLYDPDVVDTCIKIFKKGFHFE